MDAIEEMEEIIFIMRTQYLLSKNFHKYHTSSNYSHHAVNYILCTYLYYTC